MNETMSRHILSKTPDVVGIHRTRRHHSSLVPPPSYRTTTPTGSPTLPTLEPDDDTSGDDAPDSPLPRPSTPFPWEVEGGAEEYHTSSLVGSTSRWPLAARHGVFFERSSPPPMDSKYPSRIPVAKTYLGKHCASPRLLDFPMPPPLPPHAVHVLAADSRLASARSGVEEKEAELQRLQGQLKDINAKLDTINVSSGNRRAKYRSIISRGRPLPLILDDDEIVDGTSLMPEFRRDSATVVPSPLHAYNSRVSRGGRRSRLSLVPSGTHHPRSDTSGESPRHHSNPSGTQTMSSSNETDETTDSDRVSLKNFPATPHSRRSKIPRRPISSFMSTCSTFSDMPTVYETQIATPVEYRGARQGGGGVTTVYNHHPTRIARMAPEHIQTIGEQDESAETCTIASEHVDQDLGTLGGYLVTPDPTPPPTETKRPQFFRQSTPMRPAQLRVVNGSPALGGPGERSSASGTALPRFALSPDVRAQHHESAFDRRHPAYRDDPFSSTPASSLPYTEDIESQGRSYESPRYSSLSHLPLEQDFASSPPWPLSEDRQAVLDEPEPASSSSRMTKLRKLFQHNQLQDSSDAPPTPHPRSPGFAKRPLRTWFKKITPKRATKPESPTTDAAAGPSPSTALALRRVPTARASAPPLLPRQRDSTLRFEQMLMREIGSEMPTSSRIVRRASIASMQLLQRTITETTSSASSSAASRAPSTVCPPPTTTTGARPLRADFHLRNPTISTFRCSMAFL